MITLVYVDWDNLWIGLRCAGYSVEPAQAVRALLVAIDAPPQYTRVVIVTQRHEPTSTEREAIRDLITPQIGGLPEIRDTRNGKKNAADIEIGFLVGHGLLAWNPSRVVLASADADVIDVARLSKQLAPEATVIVISTKRPAARAMVGAGVEFVDLAKAAANELPKPISPPRPANDYDKAAWALMTAIHTHPHSSEAAALHTGETTELRHGDQSVRIPIWWSETKKPDQHWDRIEDLDAVLHESQDVAFRIAGPTLTELAELIRERKKSLAHEAQRIIDALVTSDLIRLDSGGRVVRRATLREGLVFPMRRAVLAHLAERRGPVGIWIMRDRHNKGAFRGTSKQEKDESWGLVNNALVRWNIVRAERVGAGTVWYLDDHDRFVSDTRTRALEILACVPASGATHEQLRRRVGAEWYSDRWPRIMADARLLTWNSEGRGYLPGPSLAR